ncbi:DNA integrity scanning diadenylate cyclase DisA [Paenibacillus apiarius]|uniref:DNA integrity scanning diadenylate cyclase DisA n=1 Tax=Paenibacillus apiarius TaxID=46240 RepID=A0ABT4DVC7_9BACL|nr:DNA integrity scanning diadenylate cyclase DisA [Paenibacillus apiarius]MBN3523779.1 DNA integrity scanning diadenylate cyclase DisA [Paenibacillus apiarius]MCY9516237.1 DNA integrity scanning diadenylate cyclase DisA [Paenibacillus apiarius]MCY9520710.1 DNA integrity scanning diadenylate cyclase DisA [Paenibacillus apiarius]MCY9552565.1 DNA integrity scanning diadenylate cyclase DisA [Paenibacillus apiarius]MCY9560961.1 DNA integrity scanning diadenylate cyclase DisA [Paenibacillus apiariu
MKESQLDIMNDLLRMVAPGTPFREGLENVLRAKTGALLVVGYSPEVMEVVDGGFSINCDFSPSYLYELAKMDGAIILSEDIKRILYANTQLIPDSSIPSTETGIRHRTAERVAKQTGKLVVSISQRRNIITLYQGSLRYALKEIGVILTKANQAIQTLEKYKAVLVQGMTNLTASEFEELVTLADVVNVLQRIEMVLRIKMEIKRYINELGTEGRLISMQLEELVSNTEEDAWLLVKDYARDESDEKIREIFAQLKKCTADELLDTHHLIRLLGYPTTSAIQDESISPRGYRVLSKIPRLPNVITHNLVETFHFLPHVMMATIEELDEVDGIGEVRARTIKEGLKRIQEQVFIDRQI